MQLSTLFIPLLSLFLLSGCGEEDASEALVSTASFSLLDTNGESYTVEKRGTNFTLDAGEDKMVLFDIFATWCPPCRAEAKHLSALQKKYGDDLIVIGLTIEDDVSNDELEKWKQKYGGEYLISNKADNESLSRSIASTIGVGQQFPIPLMILYKNGKYVTHYAGATPQEMIDSDISQALGK
jgi:thiol-disulfide isomerase/thioredoxin